MEETKTDSKKSGLGWFSIFVFFLGLLVINFVWFIFSRSAGQAYFSLLAAGAMSLILGFFLIFRNLKLAREIQKERLEMENFCRRRTFEESRDLIQRTKALEEANRKLEGTNQEFMETTKKLFEREMELTQANKRLQEADSVKSDFVSVAAHQLRTPLTGVKWSYLALLEKDTGPINNVQKEIVEKGLETIDYAISVINDLLNTARLEEGKTEFNFTVQAIGPIIDEIIKQHQPTIKEKKIDIDVDMPLSSSFSFKFDKERLAIVFDNILANAVKYTPPEGKISLKSFRTEKNIQFKITDTGIGIPKKDIDKIFSKFYRSKNAVGFETSGSGLGLYVAKTIVEKHGGTITLESEERQGTTFTITLPIS
ncbi:MAG: HAMP domain-containing sensor histidine kinase [Candidatus Moranbacteria bacterium]|nr:HAMP domain-containing sensor histidine kinase [Candidatus Moranbacteria bacterium]